LAVTASIPQADPGRSYRAHATEIDAAIARVLRRGRFVLGEEVEAFERELAAWVGARFAVAVGSGTDAIAIALRAGGIGDDDEVVTVSHTAVATVAAIEMAGARPVLVDVDPATMTIDPQAIESVVTRHTRAIVPVHLYGHPAAMDEVRKIAARHGLCTIEDAAQAHGAAWRGRRAGALGDAAAFSFYPTKNLGAFGDGGAITTDDADFALACRRLRQYGSDADRISRLRGVNSRLDEIQAAILRVKLAHLGESLERRRALAARYSAALGESSLVVPTEAPGAFHAFHLYVVRTPLRDALGAELARRGIGTAVHYRAPVHRHPAYAERLRSGSLAATERIAGEILSLPLYAELSDAEAEAVVAAVLDASATIRDDAGRPGGPGPRASS
jgi:dTDP-4-amino-4,6-dideoxygalactose transaminase